MTSHLRALALANKTSKCVPVASEGSVEGGGGEALFRDDEN